MPASPWRPGDGSKKKASSSPAPPARDLDLERAMAVHSWRVEQFVRAGCEFLHAELLAASSADIRRVEDAMKSGCSSEHALKIFT